MAAPNRILVALATLLLALVGAAGAAETASPAGPGPDGTWTSAFQAFPLGGTSALFSGEYTIERKDGVVREVQLFRTAQGKIVHRVESRFDEMRQRPVSYESRDLVNGRATVVRVVPEGFAFEIRDADGKIEKSGSQKDTQGAFFWPNLAHLVNANWESVKAGKDLDVSLFIASLNTNVSIQVVPDGKATVDGAAGDQFKVTAKNGFLRAFMSPIRLVFATDAPRRLLVFEGRSVVSDADKKNLDLRIVFGPPQPGCGAPAQEADCAAAPASGADGIKRAG